MEANPSRDFAALQKPLDQFRARTKRLKIHPQELVVVWLVGAHLVFLPWALGAMHTWAQITSLVLAVIGFAAAMLPRSYTEEHTGANRFRLVMWPRLLRFPVFWIGLLLLGYVVAQAMNPAWTYATDGKGWWMVATPHRDWLPAGVIAPFERGGPWPRLIVWSAAWLVVCTIWVGVTRRRALQALFVVLACNALLLAGFGIAQRLLGNGKIFWVYSSPNGSFFSSFIYKNHGGAYLLLGLAAACGLAGWFYLRGLRRMEKSNPSGVFAFAATCIAVGILTSYARGATVTMLAFLCMCIGAFLFHQVRAPKENRKPIVAIALVLIFGYFLKVGFEALQTREAWDRLRQGVMREDTSLLFREKATRVSLQMLGDNWRQGVGAGSFEFVFPIYQHRDPELVQLGGARMFWEHAHNDVVQFPIELGVGGMLLLFAAAGYWGVALVRAYAWENPLTATVALGLILLVGYSWWDFPFQCPAILITWCALWPAITLWSQFEEANPRS